MKIFLRKLGGDEAENTVDYVCGSGDALPLPLTVEEENGLLKEMEEGETEKAKALLIQHNLRLVVYIAKKFENTGTGIEDLISIGTIGLMKAINTFNAEKNIKLATYASRCIENEILMYIRKTSRTRLEMSIDEPLNTDWDGNELLLSDVLGGDEDTVYRNMEFDEDKRTIDEALSKLPERERQIIRLRFGMDGKDELTQKEVADLLGISQSYISRLEKRIIARLRENIGGKI
jgi:RNA polymerase sporulation-specific sigma factor